MSRVPLVFFITLALVASSAPVDGLDAAAEPAEPAVAAEPSTAPADASASNPCLLYGSVELPRQEAQLFTIDVRASATNLLGGTVAKADISGMAVHPDTMELYALQISQQGRKVTSLMRVDTVTGALELIGATGLDRGEGLSFRPGDNSLWTWWRGHGLVEIDLATAEYSLAYPGDMPISSLAWNPQGDVLHLAGNRSLWSYRPDDRGFELVHKPLPVSIGGIAMRSDGQLVLTAANTGTSGIDLLVFDPDAGEVVAEFGVPALPITDGRSDGGAAAFVQSLSWPMKCGNVSTGGQAELIQSIQVDPVQLCSGDTTLIQVEATHPEGGNNAVSILIEGLPGAQRTMQADGPAGPWYLHVSAFTAEGYVDGETLELEVVECGPEQVFPQLSVGMNNRPYTADFLVANAAEIAPDGASYEWGFGDGLTESTTVPFVSHSYEAALSPDQEYLSFLVSVEMQLPDATSLQTSTTVSVWNDYAAARERGLVQPLLTYEPELLSTETELTGEYSLHNLEAESIVFTQRRVELQPCDADVAAGSAPWEAISVAIGPGEVWTNSLVLDAASVPDDACGVELHLAGESGSLEVAADFYFQIKRDPQSLEPVTDVPTLDLLNDISTQGLVVDPDDISDEDLYVLANQGLVTIPASPTATAARATSFVHSTAMLAEADSADCENDPNAVGCPCERGDAVAGLTCLATDEWAEYPAQLPNGLKGDVILVGGCGVVGEMLLSIDQRYQHTGIMTKNYTEIAHSTSTAEVAGNHIRLWDGFLVWRPHIIEAALKYGWPGIIRSDIDTAFTDLKLIGPTKNGYTTYSKNDFRSQPSSCDGVIVPPLVVKPPARKAEAVRPLLEKAADIARAMATPTDGWGVENDYTGTGHYRFYAYTDSSIAQDPSYDWPQDQPKSQPATSCSTFVWHVLKTAGAILEGPSLEVGDIGDTMGASELDGLYLYPEPVRLQAAEFLWSKSYEIANSKWYVGKGTATRIANQIVNCFIHDECGVSATLNQNWKNSGEGNTVSPGNILNWDEPTDDDGNGTFDYGVYGHSERMLFRSGGFERVYRWMQSPDPIYVDDDADGGANDGSSWGDAFTTLTAALDNAAPSDTIWVAAGIYTPTPASDRDASFALKSRVEVYGGFAGNEAPGTFNLDDRDFGANESILSGEIGVLNSASDNSYHVVSGIDVDETAVLDGVTITGGNAADGRHGGGMYISWASPTLRNVVFRDNTASGDGGGLYGWRTSSTLTNVVFDGNHADRHGGGFNNVAPGDAAPLLVNVVFVDNSAGEYGGAIRTDSVSMTVHGGVFEGNTAWRGGALTIGSAGTVTLTNVTLTGNNAVLGGAIYNYASTTQIYNSILWGNSSELYGTGSGHGWSVFYSDVTGGWAGEGNISADPLFVDVDEGNVHLLAGSPAIDRGDARLVDLVVHDVDLDGNPRLVRAIDMGAFETLNSADHFYVDDDAIGANNGSSWPDAFTTLTAALNRAGLSDTIWVAAGTYTPTPGLDRDVSFGLRSGLQVYGGFAGNEVPGAFNLDARDFVANETIFSGNIGDETLASDNSYHVFRHTDSTAVADATAVLDGATVTGGRADGAYPNDRGGGMFNDGASPTLRNVVFRDNRASSLGGGLFGSSSSPTLINAVFDDNHSDQWGGGFAHQSGAAGSAPLMVNVVFSNNSAHAFQLGGAILTRGPIRVHGGVFVDNSAGWGGALAVADASTVTLSNVTMTRNNANFGGAIWNGGSKLRIYNSILWGNSSELYGTLDGHTWDVRYSDVRGGFVGEGNIDADPLFVDLAAGDIHLGPDSLAIDSGNDALSAAIEYDIDHQPRMIFTVDMGADEFWPYPDAVDDAFATPEDTEVVFDVLANDEDPDDNLDPTTLALNSDPTHGSVSIDGATGAITYLPDRDWYGVDGFDYQVCDTTGLCDTAVVGITVDPVNDEPVAVDDVYATYHDLIISAPGVLGNDSDPDSDELTAVLVSGPSHGTLSLEEDGSFTYAPHFYMSVFDSFTYKANDSTGDSNIATVTIIQGMLPTADGHLYEVIWTLDPVSWDDARDASVLAWSSPERSCTSSHLVTITSQEEQDALYAFYGAVLHDKWYGGFQETEVVPASAGWQWVTGETWSYTNWRAGEPNDDSGPASEQYLIGLNDGTWNDTQFILGWTKGYVVEYEGCAMP